ncbi:beta-ketoacyl-ACP synthase III [Antrihabitans cavernicola]|uniref:Ketoacyl-ACP synthase III n=1 Tax=Antrihabitans cavernicola TaxID=2495913 RepID=A0A5A7SD80_9NOCA|nr:beta-ketoacyl-ACP synthase III [Spelaeibacter cavernicola]KAA0022687.1 ketoacyl-ACP synthase III [Spelaeibacter cavernicola]
MPGPIGTLQGAQHTKIFGLGAYRPKRVVPNSEIIDAIESSDEWIQTRSGIKSRRFAGDDETIIGMSVEASRKAIEASGVRPDQIGGVIVSTSSRLVLGPAAGAQVATQLGILDVPGFDVSAGCSGFCHILALGSDMIRAGTAEYMLVVGVERLSDLLDPKDRTTAFIFADGAGAAVIGPSDTEGIGPVAWGSDGSQWEAIWQDKDFGTYFDEVAAAEASGGTSVRPYIRMRGTAVFRWAATFLEKACREAVANAGLTMEDLDVFIPHQANIRITDALTKVLKMPERIVVAKDIIETGNTSAASIPLAIEEVIRSGQAKPGDVALIMGFGAGLAYAGQVVTLPPIGE